MVFSSFCHMLYIRTCIVMILDDDAQAGVVCASLIDIQGWLPLCVDSGYYYRPSQDSLYWSEILALCWSWTIHLLSAMTSILGLLRKIVIQSGKWDTQFFSSHTILSVTRELCHAVRDNNPTLVTCHECHKQNTSHAVLTSKSVVIESKSHIESGGY